MLAPHGSPEVLSDNNLIQGRGRFDCSTKDASDETVCESDAPEAAFFFGQGKVHRLRLINSGNEGVQHFSIDDHILTVIAYDFVPIVAYETKVVTLGVGQRADVLVTANVANGTSFWMRSSVATCSTSRQPYAKAAVYYTQSSASSSYSSSSYSSRASNGVAAPGSVLGAPAWKDKGVGRAEPQRYGRDSGPIAAYGSEEGREGSSTAYGRYGSSSSSSSSSSNDNDRPLPTTSSWPVGSEGVPDPSACANDDLALTRPLYPIALPPPSWTHTFDIDIFVNASDVTLWKFDGVSFRGDYNAPTLLLASLGNTSWPAEWNGRNLYSNSSVRMIVNNPGPSQHPMHLHGSNFYVLHEGPGQWDGHTIVEPENPMRRDVQIVRPYGHLVLQFDSNNPGVWPFHCHIAWHTSGGFLEQFVVQPDALRQMQVPSIMAQTCRDWAAWTGTHVPDQIDSGL